MYGLRVAAVGDGACAVFLSGGGTQPVAIIDCGSKGHPERAVDGLRRITDLTRHPSVTIVVPHLHSDHYNGLRHLSQALGRRHVFGKVELVQARLPRHPVVTEFVARFLAMELRLGEVSGIPDLDLANELRRSTRYGLQREPRSAGESFTVGGHTFDVLWPPAELTTGMSVRVRRAVDGFDSLAASDPALNAALDRVRRSGLLEPDATPPTRAEGQDQLDEDIDNIEPWAEEESGWIPRLHPGSHDVDDPIPSYPESLTGEVREAARHFGEAANYMSLVFATPRRDFVAFGDVPLPTARRIAKAYRSPSHPQTGGAVVLAPHHGSQGATPSFGLPYFCIAQNGRGLNEKWAAKHEPCDGSVCVSTHEEGDLVLSPTWPRW